MLNSSVFKHTKTKTWRKNVLKYKQLKWRMLIYIPAFYLRIAKTTEHVGEMKMRHNRKSRVIYANLKNQCIIFWIVYFCDFHNANSDAFTRFKCGNTSLHKSVISIVPLFLNTAGHATNKSVKNMCTVSWTNLNVCNGVKVH